MLPQGAPDPRVLPGLADRPELGLPRVRRAPAAPRLALTGPTLHGALGRPGVPMTPAGLPRRGSSSADRGRWRATYDQTPYDQLPWFHEGPSLTVEQAVERGFLAPGSAVLDLGCGAGSNLLFLARRGYEAHGIDLAPGAVAAARARAASAGLRLDVREGDALALEFPAGRFAALVDIGCFHTVPIRRRGAYAQEAARVLRPGGGFVLSWVAREHETDTGPPHRPSLAEVVDLLESRFLFVRTEFRPAGEAAGPAVYHAWLTRRLRPQPPAR